MLTEVKIKKNNNEDPFDFDIVKMDIEKGIKILSDEAYVENAYAMYMGRDPEEYKYKELTHGEIISGTITHVGKDIATIDIDKKNTVNINLNKENKSYLDYIVVGNEIDVKINQLSNNDFIASYSDAVKEEKHNEIKNSIGKPVAYKATVNELIHGGYYLTIDGINVFMPGSLAGMNKLWDFESLIGKELIVMPINFSKEKKTVVVSHREYLKTLVPGKLENLRKNIENKYIGEVTGTTKFGIFAQFDDACLTGLIPESELNEKWKNEFKTRKIKPGTLIDFYTKDIISENKIILTQLEDNPWTNITNKYKPNSKAKGKVISVRNYGSFIELEKNIVGLLHISEYKDIELKEGDELMVLITKIDVDNKKIEMKRVS